MIAASSDAAASSVTSGPALSAPAPARRPDEVAAVAPAKSEPEAPRAAAVAVAQTAVPCASPDASLEEIWSAVRAGAAGNERLLAQLDKLTLEAVSPQRAIVGHGARNKITAELALPQVQQILSKVLGRAVPVVLQQTAGAEQPRLVRAPLDGGVEAGAAAEAAPVQRAGPTPEVLAQVNHPLVVKAIELLGATVREVRTRQD